MNDKRKVLIIDDEIDLGQLLKGYFSRNNFEVYVYQNLHEGFAIIKTLCPDILFIDNNFPEGNGWESVPQLAKDYPSLHIVFISAFNSVPPEMPKNAKYSIIEKPIRHKDLDKYLAVQAL
jgi:DNA-binding NtrC family response regulator